MDLNSRDRVEETGVLEQPSPHPLHSDSKPQHRCHLLEAKPDRSLRGSNPRIPTLVIKSAWSERAGSNDHLSSVLLLTGMYGFW